MPSTELGAAQRAELYRALIRSVPGGFVLLFDERLRFRVADGEALSNFGYDPAALEGRTLHETSSSRSTTGSDIQPATGRWRRSLSVLPPAHAATRWWRVWGARSLRC
ncbi:MAG: PAS domain-containing protein [Solirubrobacteraceae bacterium]